MMLYRKIEQILNALSLEYIPVIPLKGAYLAEKVYPDIGLRLMADIDLLVPRSDLKKSLSLMESLDYRAGYKFEIDYLQQAEHHLSLFHQTDNQIVEIHWTLLPSTSPFNIPIDAIWQATSRGCIAGIYVYQQSVEHLLLHLCLHAAYLDYFTTGIRSLYDIALSLQVFQDQLDWERLVQEAKFWRATRSLYLCLLLTKELFQAPVPSKLLETFQPAGFDPDMVTWAAAQIFHFTDMGPKTAELLESNPWKKRARMFLPKLFPPPSEIRHLYPHRARGVSWPLAYLLHLRLIAHRNWRFAFQWLRRDPSISAAVHQRLHINQLMKWQSNDEQPVQLSRN